MYDIKAELEIQKKSLEYFNKIVDALFDPDEMYTNHEMLSIIEACLKMVITLEQLFSEQRDIEAQMVVSSGLINAHNMLRLNAAMEVDKRKLN